ncbi:putative Zn(II)2Cys6 transcription factor [Leptodontidium sp. MPI-SDFR-AT-0119]|nr:putative Zn(II)2Cys6 transcription factor [Leptodontidium sp. MPI-SDFR-AT-0119]
MEEDTSARTSTRRTVDRRKPICSNCRKRKSKCDSREPKCSTCLAHKSPCHYVKPPSLAYVRSLEARIEQLLLERRGDSFCEENVVTENERESNRWVSQISVDSRGGVSFHNPTSVFHEAPSPDHRLDTLDQASNGTLSGVADGRDTHQVDQMKHSLVSNAAHQKRLEDLAMGNITAIQSDIPAVVAVELLRFHWCWIHPMFMFVYRPAFTRDMALSSPNQPETSYFSGPLLNVLLAHSSRFRVQGSEDSDTENAMLNALAQKAQHSLALRLTSASSISIVQALLQQSARDFAFGNSSQAWLYSGMAFRIAIDLGIHLPSEKLYGYVRSLAAEDIEIRKRLFWSCYTWDKAISLYLGRMPAFISLVESNPPEFMDDFTEHDLWEPFYGSGQDQAGTLRPAYPPQKGYMISCFTGLCKLSMILSTIMLEIYGTSTDTPTDAGSPNPKSSAFIKISSSIHKWWIELPSPVRIDVQALPAISPPLHIVSLNLLYHTTLILLHRPYIIGATNFSNPAVLRSYQICITATATIHDLLVLLTSTFGYGHTTYLNCYNTYVAATIAVQHFQLQEEGETAVLPDTGILSDKLDLKFFLGVLQKSAIAMPGLHRSIEIVKRHMQAILHRQSKKYLDSLFPVSNPSSNITKAAQQQQQKPSSSSAGSSIPTHESNSTQYHQFPLGMQPQTESNANYHAYPSFSLEGLPAFPGQDFNMGMDYNLDQEIIDPEMRTTFLGLDPHLTLRHENSDWTYGEFYI